jgi:hypothetical protein
MLAIGTFAIQSCLLSLLAALAAPADDHPPELADCSDESSAPADRHCFVWARAHATYCTNALDGTPSALSHTLCADGCGAIWEEASIAAIGSLSLQTCLGPEWGCCLFNVDQDFDTCGQ